MCGREEGEEGKEMSEDEGRGEEERVGSQQED